MLKHYIEYIHPGLILSDSSEIEVSHRDPTKVKISKNTFGFRFFDREVIEVNCELLRGEEKNYSGWYYEGEIYTKEDVIARVPDNSRLLSNMKYNNHSRVVKTRFDQYIPLEKEDKVIKVIKV